MIQFRVKFIKMVQLVKWTSRLFIAHNWYLSIKFALLSALLYTFNLRLEQKSIEMSALNCSFSNYETLIATTSHDTMRNTDQRRLVTPANGSYYQLPPTKPDSLPLPLDYLPNLSDFLDTFGGPFRLLDNRATLLYGVYSIALYIMLAIFPLELMCFIDVGFNFIRFVLSDPSCMKDLYERRERHLSRLCSWSRNQADSRFTKGAKMILNQRDLRSNYPNKFSRPSELPLGCVITSSNGRAGAYHLELFPEHLISGESFGDELLEKTTTNSNQQQAWTKQQQARLWRLPSLGAVLKNKTGSRITTPTPSSRLSPLAHRLELGYHPSNNIKQLKTRLAINHLDRPSYQVCVANRNLQKFKPFVRSEVWFKASMIIYPIFITYYFVVLSSILGLIEYFSESSLWDTIRACKLRRNQDSSDDYLDSDWTWWDTMTYYENIYTVFLLGCASSFYCSYYFGTIYELHMWIRELSQQLELSAHVIGLIDSLSYCSNLNPIQVRRKLLNTNYNLGNTGYYVNEFGGLNELFPCMRDLKQRYWGSFRGASGGGEFNQFEGPRGKYRLRDQMALMLLTRKETLLRATYVNMCLFFDELHETRCMTTIILRRTTQIAAGFAFMASITRSQFKLSSGDYWHLNSLLIGTLTVFNLYLACAAVINSGVNKMLVQIHSLIGASLKTGSADADLFEFWLRHVGSFGEDRDVTAYCIYGYKVTWSTIINIDSVILTLYFMTT